MVFVPAALGWGMLGVGRDGGERDGERGVFGGRGGGGMEVSVEGGIGECGGGLTRRLWVVG